MIVLTFALLANILIPGVRYTLTFLKLGGLALVLETPEEINTILKQTKRDEDFFGKDLNKHTSGQQGRAALALCKQNPSNIGIGKKIKEGGNGKLGNQNRGLT